ncbi:MAG: site-2 protease family protein [Verrucomicrobia bacterium]|nr:site-2 protease family protein [Verrucomicrobiota bacterium]
MILNILRVGLIVFEVLLIFNLLIIVHELGHFLAARWRGLHVDKFGVWFGRPILKRTIGGVEFSLGWIPAGGFVLLPQMATMEAVEGKAAVSGSDLPPIKPLDKIIVAAAGPLFSFLLALLFATIVWIVGRPMAEADTTTVIGYVAPDVPAAKAGFKPGDKVLEVDGHPVNRFNGMVDSIGWYVVRSEGATIPFKVQRGDQTLTINSGFEKPETTGWERKSLRQVGLQPAITPIVAKVAPDSEAAKAGLEANDEIVDIGGQKIYYLKQISEWAQQHSGQPLPLTVIRDGRSFQVDMQPGRLVISGVIENSPADVAKLQKGDKIIALNDQQIYDIDAINQYVDANPDKVLTLTVRRGNQTIAARIRPAIPDRPIAQEGKAHPIIGFYTGENTDGITWDAGGKMTTAHISPIEQVFAGVETITNTIGALLSPQSDIKLQHLSGPVMIMRTYYLLFQSDFGWQLALWFSVVFNINLAIINLLPIPVLDGGHILLAILEAIRRRPLNIRVLEVLQGACAILLIGFMLYVSFYDVQDSVSGNQKPAFNHPVQPAPSENQ